MTNKMLVDIVYQSVTLDQFCNTLSLKFIVLLDLFYFNAQQNIFYNISFPGE